MAMARRKRRTGAGVKKGIEEEKEMQARGMFSFSPFVFFFFLETGGTIMFFYWAVSLTRLS
jgi:hypothetical protein